MQPQKSCRTEEDNLAGTIISINNLANLNPQTCKIGTHQRPERSQTTLLPDEVKLMVRKVNLMMERRRRKRISLAIDNLRWLIPDCDNKSTKAWVLEKTVDYVKASMGLPAWPREE